MTGDNKRKNIATETARGDDSLESAQILLAAGKFADAVSRAYYGAFHYARAMVLANGEEPRTHGGLERLLQRDVVRTGALSPDVAKLFSRLLKFRQDADYTADFVFTRDGAAEEVVAAEAFIAAAKEVLAKANLD